GSEKLFQLVSDSGKSSNTYTDKKETEHDDSKDESLSSHEPNWVLSPSQELENLVHREDGNDGLSRHTIEEICKIYDLNTKD
ncbi:K+-H+ exchange-like protein, partial [Trifolium medium]|nr:K+-H+ exchange-like protein [Trifolium medium]